MTLVSFLDKTDQQGRQMLAFANGDASAFDALYRFYKVPMYRFFLRQCVNKAIAEELYQELWVRVIKAKDSYAHTARFSTWLYHIAHNLVIDHFRKPEPENDEDDTDIFTGSSAHEPEILAISEERVSRFLELLEQLPDAQREVFLLKEEAGLSLEEIAYTTNTSFETVKSRLRYAVKKLRQSLEEDAA